MKDNSNLKTKGTIGFILIYLILFGVFNLLAFTIFKRHTNVFWISYIFITLAFNVQVISTYFAFKTVEIETAFFGIPLASLSIFYLCAEIVIGAIFMTFQQAGFVLAFVIQVLVLAAFLVVAILSLLARDTVQEMGNNMKEKIFSLKNILVDVELMRDSCTEPELKEKLRRLSETIKYSDPITNEMVEDVEQRIQRKLSELRISLEEQQYDNAMQVCKEMELLYVERNKKLAISK